MGRLIVAVEATLWQRRRAVARAVEARARAVEARAREAAEVGGGIERCPEEEEGPRVVEAEAALGAAAWVEVGGGVEKLLAMAAAAWMAETEARR